MATNTHPEYSFVQKIWIAAGILALTAIVILLLRATFSVFLLVLAGAMIAVFFNALAGIVERKAGWKHVPSLVISVVTTVVLAGLLFWMLGAKVQKQMTELRETFPASVENLRNQLNQSALGREIVQKVSSPETRQQMQVVAQTVFKSTFGVIGDIYVVLIVGLFFTISPGVYKQGIARLAPAPARSRATQVVDRIGGNLQKWLKGQLFAMLIVFVLTAVGLGLMGIPMGLALAVIAALLNFIPNFGPLIALIPAVLVGLMQGPATAFWIAVLYVGVQITESIITPMIQHRLIHVPPALIIIAQLLMAPLTGGWGLVMATPLLVILIVIVQDLYISRQDKAAKKS